MAPSAAHDEEAARLRSVVKTTDGFFTTFFVSPYSPYVARWFARRGVSPNTVTAASMGVGTLAAAGFATGERGGLIAGAVLLQAAFTLDCVDGQLARYTQTFTPLGAYLDAVFDRAKEYLVYAGLAIGAGDVWTLASCALAAQTVRHTLDFALAVQREQATPAPVGTPTAWTWLKRIAAFPIGERFLVISVTAAIWDARVTFIALLAGIAVGLAYLLVGAGRRLRAGAAGALLRAVAYGAVIVAAALADAEAVGFALLCAVILYQYERFYRGRSVA